MPNMEWFMQGTPVGARVHEWLGATDVTVNPVYNEYYP